MPKKKNKNPLKKLANTILVDAQKTFYFGANNKGSTSHHNTQAMFVQEKIDSLIENDNFFESKLKKISLKYLPEIKNLRQNYKEKGCINSALRFLSFFYGYSSLKKQFKTEKKIDWDDK
jgi:hypothetical protein